MAGSTGSSSGSVPFTDSTEVRIGSLPPTNPNDLLANGASDEARDNSSVTGATGATTNSSAVFAPTVQGDLVPAVSARQFMHTLPRKLRRLLCRQGRVYIVMDDAGNKYALLVGSRKANHEILKLAGAAGLFLRKTELSELNELLQADAEIAGAIANVWLRVGRLPGGNGIMIDLGDANHTHVRITPGKVEIVTHGSEVLFFRSVTSRPMCMPAPVGNLNLLKNHLKNVHPTSYVLLIGWMTYTLAHPKLPTTNYVILVLLGNMGQGKSTLCRFIQRLIDPSSIGVRKLHTDPQDLAIAAQNAHLVVFDNVHGVSQIMSDTMCIAATGGALSTRQLFTDAEQQVTYLHVSLLLNGIQEFFTQPDVIQRMLPITARAIPPAMRKPEAELFREFQADLPAIQRGLFDLIAEIFVHLPSAEVSNPERMIDFSRWLAAMEMADGVTPGIYQAEYSYALNETQLNGLLSNSLAAAVLKLADDIADSWSGTPADLFTKLSAGETLATKRSRHWPTNAISLSKRLVPLQAALATQGVLVELSRGKYRTITIRKSATSHG
ncbi:MAG: hypothetical protein NTX56_04630 [Proteobacteria bacterium]|nr:hypothetical protein [Pseudomonadota bacterium]